MSFIVAPTFSFRLTIPFLPQPWPLPHSQAYPSARSPSGESRLCHLVPLSLPLSRAPEPLRRRSGVRGRCRAPLRRGKASVAGFLPFPHRSPRGRECSQRRGLWSRGIRGEFPPLSLDKGSFQALACGERLCLAVLSSR